MAKSIPPDAHKRLAQARRDAGYATASDAARAFGWNENTYRSHENGERGLKLETAYKYAKAFKVEVEYIILGKDGSITFEANHNTLAGYIDSEGHIVDYPANGVNGFRELVADNALATRGVCWFAEVQTGRPILGLNPGDLVAVFAGELSRDKYDEFVGNLAVIETDDGRQLLRRIRFDQNKKTIDVQLYPEMGAVFVEPSAISPVYAIVPRGFWRKMTKVDWDRQFEDFRNNQLPELAKLSKLAKR